MNLEEIEVERQIDLRDMLATILLHWKRIVIGTIVICICIFGYGFIKSKKEVQVATDPKSSLTDEEISEAEVAYAIYTQALTTRQILLSNVENSAISQIKSNDAIGMTNMYIITSEVDNIYDYLKNANIFSKDETDEIIKVCDFNKDTTGLDDLVSISGNYQTSTTTTVVGTSASESSKTAISVSIYANSAEACEKIGDIVETHLQSKAEQTSSELQKKDTIEGIDTEYITNKQQELNDKLSSVNDKINNLKQPTYLSEGELTYYTSLIDEESETDTLIVTSSFSWKKYLVLGLFGGLFMMCFIDGVFYAISSKVHTEDDVKVCGIASLGTIYTDTNNNLVNTLRGNDHISYTDKVSMISNEIMNTLKKNNESSLYIALDTDSNELNQLVEDLKSSLTDITVTTGNPLNDKEAFNTLLDSKNLLLLEQSDKSSFESLIKYKNLVNRNNINTVGSVVLR